MSVSIPIRYGVAITMIVGALLFAACDDPEEDVAEGGAQVSDVPAQITHTGAATPTPALSKSPAPSATLAVTPAPDWKQYENTEMGISLRYPPDLEVRSEAGPAQHQEYGGWDVDIRSPERVGRGLIVSTFVANPFAMTLDEFADEFYCARDKRDSTLASAQARACTRESMPGRPQSALVAEHDGIFYAISASVEITQQEFAAMVQSFQFLVGR